MKKYYALILSVLLLISMLAPLVTARADEVMPRYINTDQARVLLTINSSGLATISVRCYAKTGTTSIQTVTFLEKKVGSTWVRVDIAETDNEWTYNTRYLSVIKTYTHQLDSTGEYRAVTYFTVSASDTENFTLMSNYTY